MSDARAAAPTASVWSAACAAVRSRRGSVIPPRDGSGPAPLTDAQATLWPQCAQNPRAAVSILPYVVDIDGPVDVERVQAAFAEVVRVQDALRTVFDPDGSAPSQRVRDDGPTRPLELVDAPGDGVRLVDELAARLGGRPMDLLDGPLLRAVLVRVAPEKHVLVLAGHHMIWDGWSWDVFAGEIAAAYAAAPAPLPALPAHLTDLAAWQAGGYGGLLDEQLDHWRTALDGAAIASRLLPPPAPDDPGIGHRTTYPMPSALADRLRTFRAEHGASLFMIALAGFAVLAWRTNGATDVCFQGLLATRTRRELRRLIGTCFNGTFLRVRLDGNPSLVDLLARTNDAVCGALANLDVSARTVHETLRREGRLRGPVATIQIDWRTTSAPVPLGEAVMTERQPPAAEGLHRDADGNPMLLGVPPAMDALLEFVETPHRLDLNVQHRPDPRSTRAVNDLVAKYFRVLETLLRQPERRLAAVFGAAPRAPAAAGARPARSFKKRKR